jgi:hypothetical protein
MMTVYISLKGVAMKQAIWVSCALGAALLGCDGTGGSSSCGGDADGDTDTDFDADTLESGECNTNEYDIAAYLVTCENATTEEECAAASEAIQPGMVDDSWRNCAWVNFTEVLPDALETCELGDSRDKCIFRSGGEEGCFGESPVCGVGLDGWDYRTVLYFYEEDRLFVYLGPCGICSSRYSQCLWDLETGVLTTGISECACVCDPGFPPG